MNIYVKWKYINSYSCKTIRNVQIFERYDKINFKEIHSVIQKRKNSSLNFT